MPKRDTKKLLASHCETRNHTILIKGNNTKKMGDEGKKTKKKNEKYGLRSTQENSGRSLFASISVKFCVLSKIQPVFLWIVYAAALLCFVFCLFFYYFFLSFNGWIRHLVRCHSIGSSVFLYLLDQFDTREEIHAKVYEFPVNALLCIFLLFEDEHVMIEELLKLLIGEVDAQLLEAVELFEQESAMLFEYRYRLFTSLSIFFFFSPRSSVSLFEDTLRYYTYNLSSLFVSFFLFSTRG